MVAAARTVDVTASEVKETRTVDEPCCPAWAWMLGAAAAVAATVLLAGMANRRSESARRERVPSLIDDCNERIQQLEADLARLEA